MNKMLDRAYGALVGGAIGDAMGMPASFLTRAQIENTYGYIEDFLEPEKEVQSYHGDLAAGQITDDTMESIIISQVLMEYGEFSEDAFNKEMRKWAIEQKMLESTVIGPSTRRYLTALIEGTDPKLTSGKGVTNGSAMRAAPIGIAYHDNIGKCMEAAAASSLPSHGSKPAVAAACAVAVGVAMGVAGGYSKDEVLAGAIDAAKYGEKVGADITAPMVSKRLGLVRSIVEGCNSSNMNDILNDLVGIFGASMMVYESIALSFGAFYAAGGNGKAGVLAAINAGDDADTNGSICGNLCGAFSGAESFPEEWRRRVEKTSNLDLKTSAEKLLKL